MNKKHTKIILLARLDLSHARATSAMFDARLSNLHAFKSVDFKNVILITF